MSKETEAQKRAREGYQSKRSRIVIDCYPEEKEKIMKLAASRGLSVKDLFFQSIDKES